MDPVRNLYSPGAGSLPRVLAGRNEDIGLFDIAIQRLGLGRHDRSWIITGLRGVGKTVLLQKFGEIAEQHDWLHQELEISEGTQFPESVFELARSALEQMSPSKKLAERARRAFQVLKSFQLRWNLPGASEVTFGIGHVEPLRGFADSGNLDLDLPQLMIEIGKVAQDHDKTKGVLFTIDEMQLLEKTDLAALSVGLHRISQKQLPFMVAGAGLPQLLWRLGKAKTYSERLFAFRRINSLDESTAREALTKPAIEEDVRWSEEALTLVLEQTKGYPYFLQEFGSEAWNVAAGLDSIELTDVEAAIPQALNKLDDGFFGVRYNGTTNTERAYLAAMASLGAGPYKSGEVARAIDGRNTTQVSQLRDSLIKGGLCYSPRHGEIGFTAPLFDDFIRRYPPDPLNADNGSH